MKIRLQLSNNEILELHDEATLYAWKATKQDGNLDENIMFDGQVSELVDSESHTNLMNLISNCDWFALDDMNSTKYQTSAVVKIEVEN